ncbi:PLP-dependent aminotransferase family protein [Albimonas sp. CAU 1670]|uniref:MocR-like pyridoxine biosynthesis transcription factor PdxR n=1 Tax=Albimonas sp. CAU 1670 TaxID=3032599 RepID=UPI0023DC9757|nr:PLP-dependent aminotransferase family protein [Albimonas sp. CAU 1670]MDF2231913.1 PLP-dependent aminotransferase family protein [Albimonas sp. CAU 1670]
MPKRQTNSPDWSALAPIAPGEGPRTRAVYAELRRLIEARRFPPGGKLPPTRELAARLDVARGAVVAAYEQLAAEGFVEARQGAGTFVAHAVPAAPADAAAPRREPAPPRPQPGKLGSGTADARTMQVLRSLYRRALERPPDSFLHYGDPRGDLALRVEIAAYLRTARGMSVAPEQVLVTGGTQAALDLAVRATLRPGDPAWIEDPCYPMARRCLEAAGLELTHAPVDDQGLDVARAEALRARARAAYVTPSHQFPTGVTMTMPRRLALLDWAARTGAWIFEDDYDSEFRYTGQPLAALQGMDRAGRVIYLASFSKAIAPGLRLGFAVLPPDLAPRALALRDAIDRYPAALSQAVMTAFLAEGHYAAHLRRARKRLRAARDALVEGFACGPFAVRAPEQGLHLIAWAPPGADEARVHAAAEAAGLSSRPLASASFAPPARPGLVVGFAGFEPDALRAAARAASRAVETLPGASGAQAAGG